MVSSTGCQGIQALDSKGMLYHFKVLVSWVSSRSTRTYRDSTGLQWSPVLVVRGSKPWTQKVCYIISRYWYPGLVVDPRGRTETVHGFNGLQYWLSGDPSPGLERYAITFQGIGILG